MPSETRTGRTDRTYQAKLNKNGNQMDWQLTDQQVVKNVTEDIQNRRDFSLKADDDTYCNIHFSG